MRAMTLRILAIVAIALAAAAVNAYRSGVPWTPDMAKIAEHDAFVRRVGVDVARLRELIEIESAVVIDARAPQEFVAGHLDAIDILNVPEDQVQAQIARLGPEMLAGRTLVIYCSSPRCDASEVVYRALEQYYQYPSMYIYFPGWEGIVEHKLAVASGPEKLTTIIDPLGGAPQAQPEQNSPVGGS